MDYRRCRAGWPRLSNAVDASQGATVSCQKDISGLKKGPRQKGGLSKRQ